MIQAGGFRSTLTAALTAVLLAAAVMISGCAGTSVGVGYRVYDPYRRDYRNWDRDEGGYYNRWAVETRRNPNRDIRKLKREDQTEYWKWRHDRVRR
jgi:hypothetical protein